MSLTHWFPLTENLIDKITGEELTGSFVASSGGKMGNNLDTNTAHESSFVMNNSWNPITSSVSMACWVKFDYEKIKEFFSTKTSSYETPTGNIVGNHSYAGLGLIWLGNSLTNFTQMKVFAHIRGTGANTGTGSYVIPDNEWTHIALTADYETKTLKFYLNGEYKSSTSYSSLTDTGSGATRKLMLNYSGVYGGNGPGLNIPMSLNDVRIYDHTLSRAEVRELAHAKVLHYTFDDDLACGATNEAPVSGWSTYGSYWTLLERTSHGLKIQRTSSTASPTVAIQNSSLKAKMANGDIWTFSCYLYKNGQPYKSSCTEISSPTSYYYKTQSWESREDGYYRNTFKITNTPGTWMLHNNFFGTAPETDIQYEMRYIQFEKRDFATPYATTPRDRSLVNEAGYYCSNSANDVEFTEVSRIGQRAIYCKDGLQRISATVPYLTSDVLSTSIWFKTKGSPSTDNLTAPKNGYHILLAVDSGRVEISVPTNGQLRFGGYNKTASNRFCSNFTATILDGNWHLINTVFDGLTWKGYVDGVLKGTITVTSTKGDSPIVYGNKKLTIGRYYDDATSNYGATDAYIDDVRIYNTVLSEDDIKELYETGAMITKTGDLISTNFIEEKTNPTATKKHSFESLKHYEPINSNYTLLDGINFTRDEFIDTGIAFTDPNIPIIIEADVTATSTSGNICLAGCGNSNWSGPVMLNFCAGKMEFGVNGYATASDGSGNFAANERVLVRAELYTKKEDHRWYKNGNRINLGSNAYKDRTASSATLYIGTFHTGTGTDTVGSSNSWNGYVHSFSVSYGNIYKVFLPMKRNSDNVLGLYDVVGGEFYTTSAGSFTAGPVLADGTAFIHKTGRVGTRQIIEI